MPCFFIIAILYLLSISLRVNLGKPSLSIFFIRLLTLIVFSTVLSSGVILPIILDLWTKETVFPFEMELTSCDDLVLSCVVVIYSICTFKCIFECTVCQGNECGTLRSCKLNAARAEGIEPSLAVLETAVLPLNDARMWA